MYETLRASVFLLRKGQGGNLRSNLALTVKIILAILGVYIFLRLLLEAFSYTPPLVCNAVQKTVSGIASESEVIDWFIGGAIECGS